MHATLVGGIQGCSCVCNCRDRVNAKVLQGETEVSVVDELREYEKEHDLQPYNFADLIDKYGVAAQEVPSAAAANTTAAPAQQSKGAGQAAKKPKAPATAPAKPAATAPPTAPPAAPPAAPQTQEPAKRKHDEVKVEGEGIKEHKKHKKDKERKKEKKHKKDKERQQHDSE